MKFILKGFCKRYQLFFLLLFFSFAIIEIAPGDVLMHYIRPNMTNEEIEELKEELGLNDGIVEKFCGWGKKCIKGNWGYSQINHRSVTEQIKEVTSHNWLDGCSADSFHCDVNSIGIDIRSE